MSKKVRRKSEGKNKMNVLEKLLKANAVSGSEEEVRSIIMREIRKHVDEIKVDKMGNLVAIQKGDRPRVMLAAHMDEIGIMAKSILPSGEIFISPIGGFKSETLLGQRVLVHGTKKSAKGIITTKLISNDWDFGGSETIYLRDLFVDTGLKKEELDKLGITIGSPISLLQESGTLGNQNYLFGKALDDRIGCYILLELAKKTKNTKNETTFVFTVQEEVGLYGAKTASFEVNPDWAIAVDTTNANDSQNERVTRRLGNGPTITVKDNEMLANRCINGWLINIAKTKKIPIQLEVSDSGTTDALSISVSREGVPSTVVGVPVRNIHTTVGIAHTKDIENAIKLLAELLKNPPKTCIV